MEIVLRILPLSVLIVAAWVMPVLWIVYLVGIVLMVLLGLVLVVFLDE